MGEFAVGEGRGVEKILNNVGFYGWQRWLSGLGIFSRLTKIAELHGD